MERHDSASFCIISSFCNMYGMHRAHGLCKNGEP